MTAMRAPYRGNPRRVSRYGQPVMDSCAYAAAFKRRIPSPLMAGNEQQNPFPRGNCAFQRMIYRSPGAVQVVTVEIKDSIRLDPSGAQAAVPAPIEGG